MVFPWKTWPWTWIIYHLLHSKSAGRPCHLILVGHCNKGIQPRRRAGAGNQSHSLPTFYREEGTSFSNSHEAPCGRKDGGLSTLLYLICTNAVQVRVVTMETGKISMSPLLWDWNWLCEYELMTFSRERDRHGDKKNVNCVCVCLNSLLGIDEFGLKS